MAANGLAKSLAARIATLAGAGKAYPVRIPEDATLPAVAYQQIGGQRGATHSGDSGPHRTRWQVTVWGASYSAAKELAATLVEGLNTWTDTSGTFVTDAVAFVEGEVDLFDEDSQLYYVPVEITMLHVP